MNHEPEFFQWDGGYEPMGRRRWASAWVLPGDADDSLCRAIELCPDCGLAYNQSSYAVVAMVEASIKGGTHWPDVLTGRLAGCTVSERVVEDLLDAGIRSFRAVPVKIISLSKTRLTRRSAPAYFTIDPEVGIEIDTARSGIRIGEVLCGHCGRRGAPTRTSIGPRWGYQPVPGSHVGNAVFGSKETQCATVVFCTRQVVELARLKLWTGARFIPMDIPPEMSFVWKGIEYLGKKWPPEVWYPPTPDAGQTVEEWALQLVAMAVDTPAVDIPEQGTPQATKGKGKRPPTRLWRRYLAIRALQWIGPRAVPLLSPHLEHEHADVRRDCAVVLDRIAEFHDIVYPATLKQRVIELYPHASIRKW